LSCKVVLVKGPGQIQMLSNVGIEAHNEEERIKNIEISYPLDIAGTVLLI